MAVIMIEGKHKIGCGANLQYYSPKKTEVKNINDYNVLPHCYVAQSWKLFFSSNNEVYT